MYEGTIIAGYLYKVLLCVSTRDDGHFPKQMIMANF